MAVTGTPVGGADTLAERLKARLKNLFSDGSAELTAEENTIADAALVIALAAIQSELISRGATEADVANWRRLEEFQLDIATWTALTNLGKDRDVNDKEAAWASKFNRREELKEIDIVLDDETVIEPESEEGTIRDDERPVKIINLRTMNDNLGLS